MNAEQKREIENIRATIDGCLNRIAVTKDVNELNQMLASAKHQLDRYAKENTDRIHGVYEKPVTKDYSAGLLDWMK